jgi:F-type H+-transporting ATPase subunit delta
VSEQPTSLHPVAGDDAALARRYVGALYELADKEGIVDTIATNMRALRRLWDESPEWRFIANDPRLNGATIIKAAAEVAKMAELNTLVSNFLAVVAQNRRLNLLPSLVEGFLQEMSTRRGEFRAEVKVARPLSSAQREALAASLNAVAGGKVNITVTEDAALLGGLTVKMGSQFIDASVKTKLDHLERTLKGAA